MTKNLLRYYLQVIMKISKFWRSPSVEYGQYECAKLLLNYGANVNIANTNGMTPLYFAITAQNEEVAFGLLLSNPL